MIKVDPNQNLDVIVDQIRILKFCLLILHGDTGELVCLDNLDEYPSPAEQLKILDKVQHGHDFPVYGGFILSDLVSKDRLNVEVAERCPAYWCLSNLPTDEMLALMERQEFMPVVSNRH